MDDLVSTESAIVAAATAAVLSPRTRGTLRRGAVLGVAGVMKVGDVVVGAARGAARGVRGEETASVDGAAPSAAETAGPTTTPAPPRSRRAAPAAGGTPAPPAE